MSVIKPFSGYRYNSEKLDDIGRLIVSADRIEDTSEAENENNILNIAKGIRSGFDEKLYEGAEKTLSDWIEKGVLVRDEEPAIYLYEQKLEYNNITYQTRGLVAGLELTEPSEEGVMPCEAFQPKYNEAREKFIETVGANVTMINCMYIESEREITNFMQRVSEREPVIDVISTDGARQKLWKITEQSEIEFIEETLQKHTIFLLDGKNRYEISRGYARKRREKQGDYTGEEGYNYIMTLLTNACDNSFMQMPFHRLVKFPKGFKEDFFVSAAQDHFKIEKIIVDTQLGEMVDTMKKQIATARNINRFAVYAGKNYFYRLTLTDTEFLKQILPDVSDSYRSLDVTVLNKLILEDIFNITEDMFPERISYTNSVTSGIKELESGNEQCLICMNAIKAEQIRAVVTEGEILPEKSVCVFPKPAVGVIINKLD